MAALSMTRNKKVRKPARSTKGGSVLMSLPSELLREVVAKVASDSFDDLSRVRQSCKEINKAGQDNYVSQHVTFDKFHFNPLRNRKEYLEYLRRCGDCGNGEALYRRGLLELFNLKQFDFESGFQCMKKAAEKGHREAMYVYGVFLACLGDEMKQQGLQFLSGLKSKDCSEARERIMTCIGSMWVNDVIVRKMLACNARAKTCSQCGNLSDDSVTKGGWKDLYNEGDNLNGCASCKVNREVNVFCDRLTGCTRVNLV